MVGAHLEVYMLLATGNISFTGIICCWHWLMWTDFLFPFFSFLLTPQRENGALCAMKEVELFHDDPKSAESIKQLEQVIS